MRSVELVNLVLLLGCITGLLCQQDEDELLGELNLLLPASGDNIQVIYIITPKSNR